MGVKGIIGVMGVMGIVGIMGGVSHTGSYGSNGGVLVINITKRSVWHDFRYLLFPKNKRIKYFMKKITLALLMVSAIAFGQNNKKTDLQKAGLQGKVKSYRMIGYEFDEKGKPQLMNSEFYAEFNKEGLSTKMQAKNAGTIINYVDTRDEKGNLIESDSRDASNTSMSKNVYEYDARNNRVRQEVLTPDGNVFMSKKSAYDDQDRVIEVVECLAGLCDNKTIYVYGANNKVAEERKLGKDDELKSKTLFTYDANGNAVEKKVYDADNNLVKRITTVFDANNNEVEVTTYDNDGSESKKETNVYVYDKKKNWVKKTTSVDGTPTMMMEQKIKYY